MALQMASKTALAHPMVIYPRNGRKWSKMAGNGPKWQEMTKKPQISEKISAARPIELNKH